MKTIEAIKPGPKPKKKNGTSDERARVNPPNKQKHPKLKPHDHEQRRLVNAKIYINTSKM